MIWTDRTRVAPWGTGGGEGCLCSVVCEKVRDDDGRRRRNDVGRCDCVFQNELRPSRNPKCPSSRESLLRENERRSTIDHILWRPTRLRVLCYCILLLLKSNRCQTDYSSASGLTTAFEPSNRSAGLLMAFTWSSQPLILDPVSLTASAGLLF